MKTILHLPHTSLKLPKSFYRGLTIPVHNLNKYNLEMTDLGVDILFETIKGYRVKAKYSRLFCDVEKFRDDRKEEMAKYGEGVIYTKTYDGIVFHKHSDKYANTVYRHYDKYHKKADKLAWKLAKKDDILILDCHSFSDKMASHFYDQPFPDVCIGVDERFYDEQILNQVIDKITKMGLKYKINYPYVGTFVPNVFYKRKPKNKVCSIMLEINKRVYL